MFEIKETKRVGEQWINETIGFANTREQADALVLKLRELSQTQLFFHEYTSKDETHLLNQVKSAIKVCDAQLKPDTIDNVGDNLGTFTGAFWYIKHLLGMDK